MAEAHPPQRDAKQRTLFDLQKVVKLDSSAVCFSAENVADLKKTLLDPNSNKWLLLTTLRKLDCLRLEFNDLVSSEVGCAVATLTAHPKLEVARLAAGLANKWKTLVDERLFKKLEYDAELAATIPEGEPPKPPPPPPEVAAVPTAEERAAARARRRQEELDYLNSDSELEEESESDNDSGDDDWRPGGRSKKARRGGGSGGGSRGGGHTSGRPPKRRQNESE